MNKAYVSILYGADEFLFNLTRNAVFFESIMIFTIEMKQ